MQPKIDQSITRAPTPYQGLDPLELWMHFAALNAIPRRSGNEAAARRYVEKVAVSCGSEFITDDYGNCIVRSTETTHQSRRPVAIQAHLDMVCESAPGTAPDFDNDPIIPFRDGDKVAARQTTLGADNGIGVAAGLALLTDPTVSVGPLELVFTVEEEIGLLGASNFDVSLLRSQYLINLDSEDDAAITVGCAGEQDLTFDFQFPSEAIASSRADITLSVSGLGGGHSGVQIHERRANGIKFLANLLERTNVARLDYQLASFVGGSAHNAIPREAKAVIAVPTAARRDAIEALRVASAELTTDWLNDEPTIHVAVEEGSDTTQTIERQASDRFLAFLREAPHGVLAMSDQFPNTVETSANLAMVKWGAGGAEIVLSIRGLIDADVDQVASQVKSLGESAGANLSGVTGYPSWEPQSKSPLADLAAESYGAIYGRQPTVEVVHGGLECGVLVARQPGLEAVSFGPRIREAHTPREHVYASTVSTTWSVLLTLLRTLDEAH
jgi:dipeptidase D